jgi:hypothetical protein
VKQLPFLFAIVIMSAVAAGYAVAGTDHRDYATMTIAECNDCHKGEGIAPNHDADFLRGHRLPASKPQKNCADCHDRSYCADCHFGGGIDADPKKQNFGRDYVPRSHRSDFINIHPVKALDNPQTCTRCHDTGFCNECHNRFPKGSLRIKSHLRSGNSQSFIWSSEHATEARRNLQSCQTCHPEGDVCLTCHSAKSGIKINPHPRSFRGDNLIRRSDRTCRVCHTF